MIVRKSAFGREGFTKLAAETRLPAACDRDDHEARLTRLNRPGCNGQPHQMFRKLLLQRPKSCFVIRPGRIALPVRDSEAECSALFPISPTQSR